MKKLNKIIAAGTMILAIGSTSLTAFAATPCNTAVGSTGARTNCPISQNAQTGKSCTTNGANGNCGLKLNVLDIKKYILESLVSSGKLTQEKADKLLEAIEGKLATCGNSKDCVIADKADDKKVESAVTTNDNVIATSTATKEDADKEETAITPVDKTTDKEEVATTTKDDEIVAKEDDKAKTTCDLNSDCAKNQCATNGTCDKNSCFTNGKCDQSKCDENGNCGTNNCSTNGNKGTGNWYVNSTNNCPTNGNGGSNNCPTKGNCNTNNNCQTNGTSGTNNNCPTSNSIFGTIGQFTNSNGSNCGSGLNNVLSFVNAR